MTAPKIFTPEYYARMRELEADGWWNAAMRDIAEMLLRDAGLPNRGTMLDVGCGSGQTMLWFQSRFPGFRTTGLDIAPEGLAAARSLGATVTRSSALALPYRDASIDVVVTLDVVQHLPIPGGDQAALREMRRVLAPGGLLLLRTNAQTFPHIADDRIHHFHKYRTDELRRKLGVAGFDVVRCSRVNALLGLAEIPRELRAKREHGSSEYRGLLATTPPKHRWTHSVTRGWLRIEGRAIRAGAQLPLGRTILALCRA